MLERVAASGTYLAGGRALSRLPLLVMASRGRRKDSFGSRLHRAVETGLAAQGLDWTIRWYDEHASSSGRARSAVSALPRHALPMVWGAPDVLASCLADRRSAVLLHERPPSGIESVFIDSVSIDDFAGGVYAAQLLERQRLRGGYAILAGPAHDPRSCARVAGFLSRLRATVVHAQSWYLEGGLGVAERAVAAGRRGIFCANDRLAEAVHAWCRAARQPCPPLVGFDDAPVAERLGLTTIAIPWGELSTATAALVRRRLADDAASATHVVLSPRPVVRS